MADVNALRSNEQLKAISTLVLNLDAVLIAALAYRLFGAGEWDAIAALWTFGVSMLTFIGVRILTLLEPEG